jgi:hypothetical protein
MHRADFLGAPTNPKADLSNSRKSTSSFSRELATSLKNAAEVSRPADIATPSARQKSDMRPFFRTQMPARTAVASGTTDSPSTLGIGPAAGIPPVLPGTAQQQTSVPVKTEADTYWATQPPAVQALRNMPEGDEKDRLALNLANQGYVIDTQIMVWGWDPQMTMTVRQNQGYAWVPSYGQSNIAVGPGISDPYESTTYNPVSPPPGSIRVTTAFAVGTIQNPLVHPNS